MALPLSYLVLSVKQINNRQELDLATADSMFVLTFLGEKFLGVFPCQNHLARNFTQQLNDQRYVIYKVQEKNKLLKHQG